MDPILAAIAAYDAARRGQSVNGYDQVRGYDQVGLAVPPNSSVMDRRTPQQSTYAAPQPPQYGGPPAYGGGYGQAQPHPPAAPYGYGPPNQYASPYPNPGYNAYAPYPNAPLPQFQAQSAQAAAGLPGYGKPVRREEDLGPSPASFTFGPATAQTQIFELKPYRSVLPVVLTIDAVVVGAPGCLVMLQSADIAGANQLAGQQAVSIARYAPLATTRRIQWTIITPQVPCYLTIVTTAAPAAMTSITVSPTLGVVTLGSFGQ